MVDGQKARLGKAAYCVHTRKRKLFFVTGKGLKVNANSYKKHLEKELLHEIEQVVAKKDWVFLQDSAPSHRLYLVRLCIFFKNSF